MAALPMTPKPRPRKPRDAATRPEPKALAREYRALAARKGKWSAYCLEQARALEKQR